MKHTGHIIDLDTISDFNRFEVSVNGVMLPIAIGDKIQFPTNDPYLKTVVGIQLNEDGIANYIIEWFEDGMFKQNTLSLTELKVLKDNLKNRAEISFSHQDDDEQTDIEPIENSKQSSHKKKSKKSKISA